MSTGTATPLPAAANLSAARVLVVDDNRSNAVLLERLLRAAGIGTVDVLTDPREVISRCLDSRPDLILLDLHMPHLDGVEVLERLHASLPRRSFLPVLILTADTTVLARDRALAAGAKDFLRKPLDRTEVALRVRNLLNTKALHDRLEARRIDLQGTLDSRADVNAGRDTESERLHREIDRALAPGGFGIVYQPICDLATGAPRGVEALARFNCEPSRPPNEWFAQAAHVGRSVELELAAVRAALTGLQHLPDDSFVSLNASPATAVAPELIELLDAAPHQRVVLELTEHDPLQDYSAVLDTLAGLRDDGMRLAVDDTGAGYASLHSLLRLRPEIIKLDAILTRGVDRDPVRRALTAALVAFGTHTGATIVAEGIETTPELETLRALGVPWGQGYLLGRPDHLPTVA